MRFFKGILVAFTFCSAFLVGCTPEETISFDQNLLLGKWKEGTLYYRYDPQGAGVTWDTSDDVNESEAQGFTWTLVQSDLTHIYLTEMGMYGTKAVGIPKFFTVHTLTATQLVYSDAFGKRYSFTKLN